MISKIFSNCSKIISQRKWLHSKTMHKQVVFNAHTKQLKDPNLKSVSDKDIEYFQSILSPNEIITSDLSKYNIDWMRKYSGNSRLVLLPNSTEKIADILKYCNDHSIGVVPQGGNTGLVGGSVPVFDEVIISLEKMNKILDYDTSTDVVSVESGVILEAMNKYLEQFNTEAPYDLGAKGSCFVGGNIATHAGGKYLVKHGALRGYVLGLEAVLPSGQILNLRNKNRKDNTGIDLKQLFIGSEGSLGVITKIDLLCARKSKFKEIVLCKLHDYNGVLNVWSSVSEVLGRSLAAVEWMDSYAYQVVMKQIPGMRSPFQTSGQIGNDYYLLVEINCEHDLDGLLEKVFQVLETHKESIKESIIAGSDKEYDNLWKIRELVGPACCELGKVFKYDISLSSKEMDALTKDFREKCKGLGYTVGYGHIADGNLHLNISCLDKTKESELEGIIEPFIFEYVAKLKGSISAEHGLGLMKPQYLHLQKTPNAIATMAALKSVFDPKHILNPYKVIPAKEQ